MLRYNCEAKHFDLLPNFLQISPIYDQHLNNVRVQVRFSRCSEFDYNVINGVIDHFASEHALHKHLKGEQQNLDPDRHWALVPLYRFFNSGPDLRTDENPLLASVALDFGPRSKTALFQQIAIVRCLDPNFKLIPSRQGLSRVVSRRFLDIDTVSLYLHSSTC